MTAPATLPSSLPIALLSYFPDSDWLTLHNAGLSLGLLSLDLEEIKAVAEHGSGKAQRMAQRCYAVVKDQHWVLVTLLLW